MNKVRVLIVDDEPLARQGLALMLAAEPDIEIIGQCAEGASALAEIRERKPDLVFLDVQMPQLSGIEVYERLAPTERPAVIFVTAYSDYAVRAFEMSAVDYLVKPFRDTRFKAALARAREQLQRADLSEMQQRVKELLEHLRRMEQTGASAPREAGASAVPSAPASAPPAAGASAPATSAPAPSIGNRLVVKAAGEHLFIEPSELAWIEAQGEFVKLRVGTQTHLVREPLHAIEKRLTPELFVRIHRSFIVNVTCIKKITPTLYGDHDVLTSDGAKIRMSRTYRDKLKQLVAPAGKTGVSA